MSINVLNIPVATEAETLGSLLDGEPHLNFVHVDHRQFQPGAPADNLIHLGRKHAHVKRLLLALANRGYLCYTLREGVTSLVHFRRIRTLWNKVIDGSYRISDQGIVHSLTPALIKSDNPKLLVIFSSISANMYNASLVRHFEQNFHTIQKYIPQDVSILRIADLGGVIGAYYFNTHAIEDNETRIQALIREVASSLRVPPQSVVAYGGSKGGTAALYHGLLAKSGIVAVDPVLDDAIYVHKYRDLHYTADIFTQPIKDKFQRIGMDAAPCQGRVAIVCSERSPQFRCITTSMGTAFNEQVSFYNALHPGIRQHPDVSRNTIPLTVMLINMMLYGVPVPAGMRAVI